MHVDVLPKQFIEYHILRRGLLTKFQDDIITALSSCQLVVIDQLPRASGITTALIGFMAWELAYSSEYVEIDYFSDNAQYGERLFKEFTSYTGSCRQKHQNRWENVVTGSQLNVFKYGTRNDMYGKIPAGLTVYDDIYDKEVIEDIVHKLQYHQASIGKQYMVHSGNPYETDFHPTTHRYNGSRYVLLGAGANYLKRDFHFLGLSDDDIAIITPPKDLQHVAWYAPAGVQRGAMMHVSTKNLGGPYYGNQILP